MFQRGRLPEPYKQGQLPNYMMVFLVNMCLPADVSEVVLLQLFMKFCDIKSAATRALLFEVIGR